MPNITTFDLCYLSEGKRWNAEYPAKANMTFPLLAQCKYHFGRLPVRGDGRIPGEHFFISKSKLRSNTKKTKFFYDRA